jgi:hypothetical protein
MTTPVTMAVTGGSPAARAVPLRIIRGGQPIDVTVEVGERPSS